MKPSRLRLGNGALSITFDDFPGSAWTEAGPVLAQHKVHATYFPSGGLCSTNYLGVDQFTPRDLEEVAEAGHEISSTAPQRARTASRKSPATSLPVPSIGKPSTARSMRRPVAPAQ